MRINNIIVALVLFFIVASTVNAQEPYLLPTDKEDISIPWEALSLYVDTSLNLTYEQVSHQDFQANYNTITEETAFILSSYKAYWVTFKLTGEALQSKKWFLEIPDKTIPYIDFYISRSDGQLETYKVGANRAGSNRPVQHKNYLFDLPNGQEEIQIYARITATYKAPLLFWLRTNTFLLSYANGEYILLGVFYGILLIMAVYNFLTFLIFSERVNLFFGIYIISCMLLCFQEDGIGMQYIWPEYPTFNTFIYQNTIHIYIACLIIYSTAFLNLHKEQLKLLQLTICIAASMFLYLSFNIDFDAGIGLFSYFPVLLMLYIATIRSIKGGYQPANFFLLAQSFTFLGLFVVFIRKAGYVEYSLLTSYQLIAVVYMLNIALVFEILLFSIAQVKKILFQRLEKEQKIVASEKRFRNIFESSFDAILVYDPQEKQIIDANESATKLFEYDKNNLMKMGIRQLLHIEKEKEQEQNPTYLNENYLKQNGKIALEITGARANQTKIDCDVSFTLLNRSEKEAIVLTIKDISQQKKAEKELKNKVIEITQKNQELKTYINSNSELESFAYIVSHDMKQPLRTIMSFSNLLSKHLNKKELIDKHTKEFLYFISKAAGNMEVLINDLLEHAKISSAGNLQFKPYNLNNLLEIVALNLNDQLTKNKAQLTIGDLPTKLPISKTKMNQLFQNIISNAIKFRKKDQVCTIEVQATEKDTCWEFSIVDNGIGIEQKYFDKIFQIFQKLHTPKEYKGSGIGLTTCKKIIELHGGKIWVASKRGEGTTFFFTILKELDTCNILTKELAQAN